MEVTPLALPRYRARLADFFELTKPRITFLVLITTLVGFYMGSRDGMNLLLLFHTILGTGLIQETSSMFERRLRTTWTLGLCLVLACVACGRGGAANAQASPRTYVSTVCGAVLDWKSV